MAKKKIDPTVGVGYRLSSHENESNLWWGKWCFR